MVYILSITLSQSLIPKILCCGFIMVSTSFIVFTNPLLKVLYYKEYAFKQTS